MAILRSQVHWLDVVSPALSSFKLIQDASDQKQPSGFPWVGSSSEAPRGAGSCNSQEQDWGTAVSMFWLPARGSSWCVRVQSEAAPVALISFTVTRAAPAPAPCSSTEGTVGGEGLHQDPHTQNHSDICELAQRQRKYGVDRNSKSLFSHQQKTPHF